MTQDEKRIKIAEACGWNAKPNEKGTDTTIWGPSATFPGWSYPHQLPNYFSDLNAIHEAEKVLTPKQCDKYVMILREVYGARMGDLDALIAANAAWGFASAAQRAEAFGLTLNLWKE